MGDERGYGRITLLDLSLSFSSSNVLFEAPIELVVSDIVMNILAKRTRGHHSWYCFTTRKGLHPKWWWRWWRCVAIQLLDLSTFWNPSFFTKTAQSRSIHLQNLLKSSKSFRTFVRKSKKINDGWIWIFDLLASDCKISPKTGQVRPRREKALVGFVVVLPSSANSAKNLCPFSDLPPKSSEPAQW